MIRFLFRNMKIIIKKGRSYSTDKCIYSQNIEGEFAQKGLYSEFPGDQRKGGIYCANEFLPEVFSFFLPKDVSTAHYYGF